MRRGRRCSNAQDRSPTEESDRAWVRGGMLYDIATPDTAMARVSLAIQWIRREFAQPLRVEDLAKRASMSVSAFHRHFKAVTALSHCSIKSASGCCRHAHCCWLAAETSPPPHSMLVTKARLSSAASMRVRLASHPRVIRRGYSRRYGGRQPG